MAPWDRYNLQLQLLSYWKSSLQILLTKFSAIYLCFYERKIKICFWHTVFQSSWLRTSRIFPLYRVIQTSSAANCSGSLSHTNQWKASRTSCWLFYHERQHREISSKAARRIFINCVYFLVQCYVQNHPFIVKNPHHSPVNVLHGKKATVTHNTFLHLSFWKWLHEDDTVSFLMTCPMFWGHSVRDSIADVEQMSLWCKVRSMKDYLTLSNKFLTTYSSSTRLLWIVWQSTFCRDNRDKFVWIKLLMWK